MNFAKIVLKILKRGWSVQCVIVSKNIDKIGDMNAMKNIKVSKNVAHPCQTKDG